jgi:hypothetical protein
MATMAQRRDVVNVKVQYGSGDVDLELPLELVKAMVDFRSNKDSGRIEMHYSQGGVAKIFANVARTYK